MVCHDSIKYNVIMHLFFCWVYFILMYLFCALIDIPSVDRATKTITTQTNPFPREIHVISIGSFIGTLLLNKKTMFPLKLQRLLGALELLLFKV